jgi:hypothetical protein
LRAALAFALALGCASEPMECPGGRVEGTARDLADALDAGRATAGRVQAVGVQERPVEVCLPQLRHIWRVAGPEWKALDEQLREQELRLTICGAGLCIIGDGGGGTP